MEGIVNYPFWQTLSINMFDSVAHIVRLGLTVNKCSPFEYRHPKDIEPDKTRDCNQWLTGGLEPDVIAEAHLDAAHRVEHRPVRLTHVDLGDLGGADAAAAPGAQEPAGGSRSVAVAASARFDLRSLLHAAPHAAGRRGPGVGRRGRPATGRRLPTRTRPPPP